MQREHCGNLALELGDKMTKINIENELYLDRNMRQDKYKVNRSIFNNIKDQWQ